MRVRNFIRHLRGGDKFAFAILSALLLVACYDRQTNNKSMANCGLNVSEQGGFVKVPSGSFIKGKDAVYPEERPEMRLHIEGFWIAAHEVTNQQFAGFVEAAGYVTDAEQSVLDERNDAGSAVFLHPDKRDADEAYWQLLATANWRSPYGDEEKTKDWPLKPVTHISKRDAAAYAEWAGGRLPTEAEWEFAANLGLADPDIPTSNAYDNGKPKANTWQGIFPVADLGEDGFKSIAPVGCFPADELGLYDMIGNVWEWTDTPYGGGAFTIKGGSYLCANNFCRRYRPAARQPQEGDFSASHIGFRIVKDVSE